MKSNQEYIDEILKAIKELGNKLDTLIKLESNPLRQVEVEDIDIATDDPVFRKQGSPPVGVREGEAY